MSAFTLACIDSFMKKINKNEIATFGDNTRLVIGGRDAADHHGFVNPAVYHGSTVLAPTVRDVIGYMRNPCWL